MTLANFSRIGVVALVVLAAASCFDVDPSHYLFTTGSDAGVEAVGCARACDTPPPAKCVSATVLEAYPSQGRCTAGSGCGYNPVHVTCANGCLDGHCLGEPCAGVFCDQPPAATCNDSAHLRTYETLGSCNAGSCTYGVTVVDCPGGCSAGVCGQNACAGKVCQSPPANECLSAHSLRAYASPGSCIAADGHCAYTASEMSCAQGCQNGACLADACSGVSCAQPPADSCVSDTQVRSYQPTGACSQGACVYGSTETTCDPGMKCLGGACVIPSSSCNSATCDGCCAANACITPADQTVTQCGSGAAACGACSTGYVCANASCQDIDECATNHGGCDVHATCINVRGGRTCECTSGYVGNGLSCTPAGADAGVCNSSNCDGCCAGGTCKQRPDYTQFQCGSGTPGTACVSCLGACDLDAGQCASVTFDGGFPLVCVGSSDCGPGKCCDSGRGFSSCRADGGVCWWSDLSGTKKCNGTTGLCE